ncbi:MAG: hypothetical protein CMB80_03285 [Flammeovirgaceae bacterium]|nr:hypothetical protein [Flammeovirgaceae bacterium]
MKIGDLVTVVGVGGVRFFGLVIRTWINWDNGGQMVTVLWNDDDQTAEPTTEITLVDGEFLANIK